ncbi:MAG: UDP-N-acetylmuramate dehydrogenase [Alkalispirochaeta sp.]|jgi:UDP-N-acetylmuramate dehydrogenase
MGTLQRIVKNFNLEIPMRFDEPLAPYTTFKVGGPAEAAAFPNNKSQLAELLRKATSADIPVTVLGGGANVVVSDGGISGLVVLTGGLNNLYHSGSRLFAGAGLPVSDAAAYAANHNFQGLAFIYAMPGSVGGAVWMNARCYDGEIAGVLESVDYVTLEGEPGTYRTEPSDFGYKVSPFQDGKRVIVEAVFLLAPVDSSVSGETGLWKRMKEIEEDRRGKGHFDAPCAGSVFKNDRLIGEPSGKVIDRLGLRGLRRGGAQISPRHGNIIINTGNATAREIRDLVTEVRDRVYRETGHVLEPEILFPGNWT